MESLKKSADEHKKVLIPQNSLQSHDKYIGRLKTFDVTLTNTLIFLRLIILF